MSDPLRTLAAYVVRDAVRKVQCSRGVPRAEGAAFLRSDGGREILERLGLDADAALERLGLVEVQQ